MVNDNTPPLELAKAMEPIVADAPPENGSAHFLPAQLRIMSVWPTTAVRHVVNLTMERLRKR